MKGGGPKDGGSTGGNDGTPPTAPAGDSESGGSQFSILPTLSPMILPSVTAIGLAALAAAALSAADKVVGVATGLFMIAPGPLTNQQLNSSGHGTKPDHT